MVPKPLDDSGLAGDVPGGLGRFLGKGKGLAALSASAPQSRRVRAILRAPKRFQGLRLLFLQLELTDTALIASCSL